MRVLHCVSGSYPRVRPHVQVVICSNSGQKFGYCLAVDYSWTSICWCVVFARKNAVVDNDDHACIYAQARPSAHVLRLEWMHDNCSLDIHRHQDGPRKIPKPQPILLRTLNALSLPPKWYYSRPSQLIARWTTYTSIDSALQLPVPSPRNPPHNLHGDIRALRLPRHHRPQQRKLLCQPHMEGRKSG